MKNQYTKCSLELIELYDTEKRTFTIFSTIDVFEKPTYKELLKNDHK